MQRQTLTLRHKNFGDNSRLERADGQSELDESGGNRMGFRTTSRSLTPVLQVQSQKPAQERNES